MRAIKFYSNWNLPKHKWVEVRLYPNCIVLMTRYFDLSYWWAE